MTTINLISPVDGSVYAERTALPLADAQAAVARARKAQGDWAAQPLETRIATVLAGIVALEGMAAEIVPELAWQMGRPVRYGGEFGGVRERADYMAGIASDVLADEVVENSDNFTRLIAREAQGVVFVIAPWNYPFLTAVNTIVPALIAGNAVVLKHASQTLLAGERLAQAFHAGGVPQDVFQNVVLDHATTESLIGDRAFDFINFTGSVGGGRAIEKAAAGTFSGTGLELGGKDPGYVRADADLEAAVDGLMDGAMFNSGQCCCGIERIYVHESLYGAFVEEAVTWARAQRLGNPLEQDTTMGPMAHKRFAAIVRDQVAEAVAQGAHALIDPSEFSADDGGAYLAPQILTHVTHDMRVMREESFGPVVGIMSVKDDAEAIRLMNDCAYGLTASIWTRDAKAARSIGGQIQTGTVLMNRCDYLDPALCWTGCKDTGRGAALSALGYLALTRAKSYHLKKA
ncbi:aldehyde dehydrogenase family protein [Yoonia sp.]|uniref:aldehyde dehydrogenase family protein n=1 Tax=Yoonia sp. TaxID=2212373 RepID=UPI00391AD678